MPPINPPLNPSQAVERIREIIVGRHLERIEQRVANLESGASTSTMPTAWEDRMCTNEARLEALQHALQRLSDQTREETTARMAQHEHEIQRLAGQIQRVAAMKSAPDPSANHELEQKIGGWLGNWQTSLHSHLDNREQRMASQIRQEMATLWESMESQITHLQSRSLDQKSIEQRFARIAAAARALAESAAPPEPSRPEFSPPR